MYFVLIATDRSGQFALRTELRPRHLDFLKALGDQLVLAGPFLSEAGDMIGSLVVVEAETLDEAHAVFGRDPFMLGGLFGEVIVRPWRLTINNT